MMIATRDRVMDRLIMLWAVCGIGLLLCTAFFYLRWSGFAEQGEINFASLACLVYQGQPLYTAMDFPGRYSIQHGPIVYLLAGGIMKLFGAGYTTAKLSGVLATIAAVALSFVWFVRLTNKRYALMLTGLEVWLLFHWHHIYFIRPDSMSLLCVVISLLALTTVRSKIALVLGLALSLGVMFNLKIHGILYFLPIAVLAWQRLTCRELSLTVVLALVTGLLPFALPQISLHNYFLYIFQSLHHGFYFKNFIPKLVMDAELLLIPTTIGVLMGADIRKVCMERRGFLAAMLVALAIVSVISSKGGSGTNHLMPFVPMCLFLTVLMLKDAAAGARILAYRRNRAYKLSLVVLGLIVLTSTVSGFGKEQDLMLLSAKHDRNAVTADIDNIAAAWPGRTMAVGYGTSATYPVYRDFVAKPVFKGNPLLVEAVAMEDMTAVGWQIPEATIQSLNEGFIKVWLIPKGDEPFTLEVAPGHPMFDKRFRQAFAANYDLLASTDYFDVWVYNK